MPRTTTAAARAASQDQRDRITQAAFELAPGELLASAVGEGAELEGITTALLLTDEDDFNALAATVLAGGTGPRVYRLTPVSPATAWWPPTPPPKPSSALTSPVTMSPIATTPAPGSRWHPPTAPSRQEPTSCS
jgi:hypothetical protein